MITVSPGDRYGRSTIIREAGRRNRTRARPEGYRAVEARCDCGTVYVVLLSSLRRGNTQSCGCLKRETGIRNLLGGRAVKLSARSA